VLYLHNSFLLEEPLHNVVVARREEALTFVRGQRLFNFYPRSRASEGRALRFQIPERLRGCYQVHESKLLSGNFDKPENVLRSTFNSTFK
jgi:hypothetical protein